MQGFSLYIYLLRIVITPSSVPSPLSTTAPFFCLPLQQNSPKASSILVTCPLLLFPPFLPHIETHLGETTRDICISKFKSQLSALFLFDKVITPFFRNTLSLSSQHLSCPWFSCVTDFSSLSFAGFSSPPWSLNSGVPQGSGLFSFIYSYCICNHV